MLDTKPSAEVERRILGILKQYEVPTVGTDLLRALRSIEILEAIGDSDAQQVLETLAKGLPEALVTREAQAALMTIKETFKISTRNLECPPLPFRATGRQDRRGSFRRPRNPGAACGQQPAALRVAASEKRRAQSLDS